jgi:phenylpropionate dioxygenase-like ring-hydroxylating dioxygenase large terminal subunit
MFVRNCWYAAAWSNELDAEPKGYIFLNEPVVIYRKRNGTPAALADRCAHRAYPLSKGRVVGNRLMCGYHGLCYEDDGACSYIPGQRNIPEWARVKSYPVVERHGCIWIWMGDRTLADDSLVPDLTWKNPWGRTARAHLKCNYQLACDNLSDLSHVAYLHSANIGTAAVAEHGEVETEVNGNMVRVSRWTLNKPAPPMYQAQGGFPGNIDRWQISDFHAPSLYKLNFGAAPAGKGRDAADSRDRWAFHGCQWGTPETETTTHWFYAYAHNFGPDRDAAGAQVFFDNMHIVFNEDFEAIECQQRSISSESDVRLRETNADAGISAARRVVSRLIEAESMGNQRVPSV